MSRTGHLTQDVLAVLGEIRERFDKGSAGRRLPDLRREATEIVARRTGRVVTTLHDALARRLELSASQFDHLVEEWLLRDSSTLCNRLVEKASQDSDRAEIYRFFNTTLPPEPSRPTHPPRTQTLAVELDPDVAQVFRNSKAVNETLRALICISRLTRGSEAAE